MLSKTKARNNDQEIQGQSSSRPDSRTTRQSAQNAHPAAIVERARLNPNSLKPSDVLQLQRAVGNRTVGRLLSEMIQAKPDSGENRQSQPLLLSEPDDRYEQEADKQAEQVVSRINSPTVQPSRAVTAQRAPAPEAEEEEEEVMRKPLARSASAGEGTVVPAELGDSINRARGGGQSLPESVRTPMENAFGADFGGVKIHTDSQSDQLNHSLQAKAFTTGRDIFFRQGAYDPGSRDGQQLIAHELTHVLQQNGVEEGHAGSDVSRTVQTYRVGLIPTLAWRNAHVATNYTPARVLGGHLDARAEFAGDAARVLTRNNAAMGVAPALPLLVTNNRSDESNSALLSRASASLVDPEVDHIVPVARNGSNDILNARVLSKTENTNPATSRPIEANNEIRAIWYEQDDESIGANEGRPITRGIIENLRDYGYLINPNAYNYAANGEANGNLVALVNNISPLHD